MRSRFLFVMALMLSACTDRAIDEGQKAVRATLRDPGSAQFERVKRCGKSTIISGDVNAKNAFGGYVGKEVFVAQGREAAILGDSNPHLFSRLMRACTEEVLKEVRSN